MNLITLPELLAIHERVIQETGAFLGCCPSEKEVDEIAEWLNRHIERWNE